MREVVFYRRAEREFQQSIRFYALQSEKIGLEFSAEVQRLLKSIQANPDAGVLSSRRTRKRLCKRFPFGIIYRVLPTEVHVVAIMQLRRRPNYWKRRFQ